MRPAVGFALGASALLAVLALRAYAHFAPPAPVDPRLAPLAGERASEASADLAVAVETLERGEVLRALARGGYLRDERNAIAWDETYPVADVHRFHGLDDDVIQALRRRFASSREGSLGYPSASKRVVDAADEVARARGLPPETRP